MTTVIWDNKCKLPLDFIDRGGDASSQRYCGTLDRLRKASHRQRLVLLCQEVIVLHDNTRPHTANRNCDWPWTSSLESRHGDQCFSNLWTRYDYPGCQVINK
jgi:hypothetical protein